MAISVPSIKDVVDLADQIGIIKAFKSKLVSQPDPALDQLTTVLDEISKIFNAMNIEITKYLSLWFDASDQESVQKERSLLLSMEEGQMKLEMLETRGHCAKITNIYDKYLNPWLRRILSSDEQELVGRVFRELRGFDSKMVDAIEKLAKWLIDNAAETLDLVDSGQYQEANEFIKNKRKEIQPMRILISERIQDLYRLQAEFISVSGAL
ncbi:MAG: hypothetical protein WB511_05320 [Nitrososphaeraceae archaeon]